MRSIGNGRYRLDRVLGEGAAAEVWQAYDTQLRANRAIKVLHLRAARSESMRIRLRAEARAMAALDHPNVLRVYDIGTDDDVDFVVMELAHGALADLLRNDGPIHPDASIRYTLQMLSGLAAAHAVGIVHRDIKPQNILLSGDGNALVADFGIALLATDDDRGTRTGVMMGSVPFMAPEQRLDARSVGPQADVYAVGATLYCMLTAANPVDLFAAQPDSPRWNGVPEAVVPILRKAVAYDRRDRYQDCRAMAMELLEVLPHARSLPVYVPAVTEPEFFPKPSDAFVQPVVVPTLEQDFPRSPDDESLHTAVEYLEELDSDQGSVHSALQLLEHALTQEPAELRHQAPNYLERTRDPSVDRQVGPTARPGEERAVTPLQPEERTAPPVPVDHEPASDDRTALWFGLSGALLVAILLVAYVAFRPVTESVAPEPEAGPVVRSSLAVEPAEPAPEVAPEPEPEPEAVAQAPAVAEQTPVAASPPQEARGLGPAPRGEAPAGRWRAWRLDGSAALAPMMDLQLSGSAFSGEYFPVMDKGGALKPGVKRTVSGDWDPVTSTGEIRVGNQLVFQIERRDDDVLFSKLFGPAGGNRQPVLWRRQR